ncbi:hypothetical protein HOD05_03045 [Candidatus Woesearchaeota archaeon]|jgi:hypothetical protein|nr:hypothetical protein [Candidatus Woesearchaeota archaeon]MBT4151350.1 hypothetical protein [Candidatus Woesearchaeota archaeon]MBT4247748.1 hypothetical protein [Candidatus Woesearchaeota archaeon]MBT4434172.1 hypothetical protein [Candidatus Woesearchaeota archaeon]MBT7332489.1 hypothetical protein [Candidatus Woesearchaeota archaeon]
MNIHRIKYKDIEQTPKLKVKKNFKQQFQGSAPAPFIGRFGYPHVNIGFLSPQFSGDTSYYDSPKLWSSGNFKMNQIANMRYGLVNSRQKWKVKDLHSGGNMLNIIQEVGMAKRPAELDVTLKKAPSLNLKGESEVTPWGPASGVQRARITSNTKVDHKVEKVVFDTDLKAAGGMLKLYKKGFEEGVLSKLISVGNLGIKKNRKLVPTRWSITAADSTICKQLTKEVKDYPVGDFQLHFGGNWGNYYLLLYYPEVWGYELFETYLKNPVNPWSKQGYAYSTDHESYGGRKTYPEETAGGYFAAQLPVLEKMKKDKRQYRCIALRFITDEYKVPLGVWVCRESARKSANTKPLRFASEKLMLDYAKEFVKNKFGFNLNVLLDESKLLKENKTQLKLTNF